MKIAAVIPARFSSSRFPGKPLALIEGKTIIERVYDQVKKADCFSDIIVATDDERICDEVKRFGGHAVITPTNISSGTERIWQVIAMTSFEGIINIQGDEPLISEHLIREIFKVLQNKMVGIVTAACKNANYEDFLSPHMVKVILNSKSEAIYFSRSPIPYQKKESYVYFFHHVGIYGYKRRELEFFVKSPRSELEKIEDLEQLRFIENGKKIKVLITNYHSKGIDIPSDIAKIEAFLKGKNG